MAVARERDELIAALPHALRSPEHPLPERRRRAGGRLSARRRTQASRPASLQCARRARPHRLRGSGQRRFGAAVPRVSETTLPMLPKAEWYLVHPILCGAPYHVHVLGGVVVDRTSRRPQAHLVRGSSAGAGFDQLLTAKGASRLRECARQEGRVPLGAPLGPPLRCGERRVPGRMQQVMDAIARDVEESARTRRTASSSRGISPSAGAKSSMRWRSSGSCASPTREASQSSRCRWCRATTT